jgi:hypothetical protein
MQSPPNSGATWITFPPSSNYEQHHLLAVLKLPAVVIVMPHFAYLSGKTT